MKHMGRTSVGNQPSGCRPPGFGEVPVVLRGAFRIEFLNFFCFLGGYGGPKDYVTEVSSSLDNFHMMKNLIFNFRNKHLDLTENAIFNRCYNFRFRHATNV